VGLAGKVVVYCGEHVVIGTVNHGYAHVDLAKVHSAAMVLRQTGQLQSVIRGMVRTPACGSRNHIITSNVHDDMRRVWRDKRPS
jgi:hypothetical protein